MTTKRAGIIPPQGGTVHEGMGSDLFNGDFPAAIRVAEMGSDIFGQDMIWLCTEASKQDLKPTHIQQSALAVMVLAYVAAYEELLGSLSLDGYAGSSVGQVLAMRLAGILQSDEITCQVIAKRGQLMHEAAEGHTGAMVILLNDEDGPPLDLDGIRAECENELFSGAAVIGLINGEHQVVLSGFEGMVKILARNCVASNFAQKSVTLRGVAAAFHSPVMLPAVGPFSEFLEKIPFGDPVAMLFGNTGAQVITTGGAARQELVDNLTGPVNWLGIMQQLEIHGLTDVTEIGPGEVLANLVKKFSARTTSRRGKVVAAGVGAALVVGSIAALLIKNRR